MNVDVLWNKILKQLETELNSLSYTTWFAETSLYKLDKNVAYIVVPMQIHKRHLSDHYANLIIEKLQNETGSIYDLEFFINSELEEFIKNENDKSILNILDNESNVVEKDYSYESTNLKKEFNFDRKNIKFYYRQQVIISPNGSIFNNFEREEDKNSIRRK